MGLFVVLRFVILMKSLLSDKHIMKRFYKRENRKAYQIHKLVDGVDLFKVEVCGCVYEVFKSPAGEWRLLYHSPDSRMMSVRSLGSIVDAELVRSGKA